MGGKTAKIEKMEGLKPLELKKRRRSFKIQKILRNPDKIYKIAKKIKNKFPIADKYSEKNSLI